MLERWDGPEYTARELYMRNVSSNNLMDEGNPLGVDKPFPQRHEGDTIEFHRWAPLMPPTMAWVQNALMHWHKRGSF